MGHRRMIRVQWLGWSNVQCPMSYDDIYKLLHRGAVYRRCIKNWQLPVWFQICDARLVVCIKEGVVYTRATIRYLDLRWRTVVSFSIYREGSILFYL